jgi:hypothetical protein
MRSHRSQRFYFAEECGPTKDFQSKHTTALLESETLMGTIMEKGGHETRRFRVQSESVLLIQVWFHTCLSAKHATATLNCKEGVGSDRERAIQAQSESTHAGWAPLSTPPVYAETTLSIIVLFHVGW